MNSNSKAIKELTQKELQQIYDLIYSPGVCSFERMQIYIAGSNNFSKEQFSFGFREAYCSSDDLFPHKRLIRQILFSKRINREFLMERNERKVLNELPGQLRVFRGMAMNEFVSKDYGVSWTLDYEVAKYFASKYSRNFSTNGNRRVIVAKTINKENVIAYMDGRSEKEILFIDNRRTNSPTINQTPG